MKHLPAAAAAPQLVAALERALDPHAAGGLDASVPAAIWRRALAGPAAEFLSRPGKQLRASLVTAGWALGGGAPEQLSERLPLVIELLHAGSLIVDDVEDGSTERRGAPALHELVGVPLAINTGSWMYFWALEELAAVGLPPAIELAAHRAAASTLARCHQGQALDLAVRIADVEVGDVPAVVAATTRLKTGALCRLAAELGAIAAGAAPDRRQAIAAFGEAMGIGLQMLDDLGALTSRARRGKGREDLRGGRPTWPWAWLAARPFAWARLSAMGRAVAAGAGDVDALIDALAGESAARGRAEIRTALDGALERLVRSLGPHPIIAWISDEIARMERGHG
jgi:geranylgeranyl pyrophosphate synthase